MFSYLGIYDSYFVNGKKTENIFLSLLKDWKEQNIFIDNIVQNIYPKFGTRYLVHSKQRFKYVYCITALL
jgi:hypothetical protein